MEEIWKPVVGYEGHYEVSSLGRVKNVKYKSKSKLLSPRKHHHYKYTSLSVALSINGVIKEKIISRLVAQAFISNPENKSDVNHIDNNPLNNNLLNLEWTTHSENLKHAVKTGRYDFITKHNQQIVRILELRQQGNNFTEIGKIIGVSKQRISQIRRRHPDMKIS